MNIWMLESLLPNIIKSLISNRQNILRKTLLVIGVFFAIYYISKFITQKVEKKIIANSLQDDIYIQKLSKFTGKIIFIFLMIFNVLVMFQIIGFDTAIIM